MAAVAASILVSPAAPATHRVLVSQQRWLPTRYLAHITTVVALRFRFSSVGSDAVLTSFMSLPHDVCLLMFSLSLSLSLSLCAD